MNNFRIKTSLRKLGFGLALLLAMDASADHDININAEPGWTGPYFGTSFGSGAGNITQTFNDKTIDQASAITPISSVTNTTTDVGSGHQRGHATGSIANLFVGYNFNPSWCNLVLGGQLEGTIFSDISLKGIGLRTGSGTNETVVIDPPDTSVTSFPFREETTHERTEKLSSMFSLVARGGYLVNPTWLIYLLGGATEGNFVTPDADNFGGRRNKWELGYTLGGGVEYKLNQNWSIRGEYRYLHFIVDRHRSNTDFTTTTEGAVTSNTQSTFNENSKTNLNFNLGLISIVYHFLC